MKPNTTVSMIAACTEARNGAIKEIERDFDARGLRWKVDREPCMYAIDDNNERLNDGDWTVWKRRRLEVDALIAKYGDKVKEVVVQSGIDIAANKLDHESGNYNTYDWEATIWTLPDSNSAK